MVNKDEEIESLQAEINVLLLDQESTAKAQQTLQESKTDLESSLESRENDLATLQSQITTLKTASEETSSLFDQLKDERT